MNRSPTTTPNTTMSTTTSPADDTDSTDIEQRVAALERKQRDKIERDHAVALESKRKREQRVKEAKRDAAKEERDELRERVEALEDDKADDTLLSAVRSKLGTLWNIVVGDENDGFIPFEDRYDAHPEEYTKEHGPILRRLARNEFAQQDDLAEEQKTRSQTQAKQGRQIQLLADGAGVDLGDLNGDDAIATLSQEGGLAKLGHTNPGAPEERAAMLLRNIDEWKSTTKRIPAADGPCHVFRCPDIKEELRRDEGRTFQTIEVTRVFEAIEDFAAASDRFVKRNPASSNTDVNQLFIEQTEP